MSPIAFPAQANDNPIEDKNSPKPAKYIIPFCMYKINSNLCTIDESWFSKFIDKKIKQLIKTQL